MTSTWTNGLDEGTTPPNWAREGEVHTTGVPFRTPDAETQIVAVNFDAKARFFRLRKKL